MLRIAVALVLASILSGCSSTRYEATWSDPSASPITLSGQKVAAFYFGGTETTRRAAEDVLARELSARGAQGIAGYTLLPGKEPADPLAARQRLQQAGVEGAVTMRVVGRDKETTYVPGSAYAVPVGYRSMWGYWGTGWGYAYEPGHYTQNQVVYIESNVYSIADEKLVWSSRTKTYNPANVKDVVDEIVDQSVAEMKRKGVITGGAA